MHTACPPQIGLAIALVPCYLMKELADRGWFDQPSKHTILLSIQSYLQFEEYTHIFAQRRPLTRGPMSKGELHRVGGV